ncbi:hypothetical protein V2G26_005615 [Clonostachys chloroleuca]
MVGSVGAEVQQLGALLQAGHLALVTSTTAPALPSVCERLSIRSSTLASIRSVNEQPAFSAIILWRSAIPASLSRRQPTASLRGLCPLPAALAPDRIALHCSIDPRASSEAPLLHRTCTGHWCEYKYPAPPIASPGIANAGRDVLPTCDNYYFPRLLFCSFALVALSYCAFGQQTIRTFVSYHPHLNTPPRDLAFWEAPKTATRLLDLV